VNESWGQVKAIIFYKAESQDVHVKGFRLLSIFGRNESDDIG
jgi:hypothetical protein